MKLTRQMFIDGIEDVDALKVKDLKEFCAIEELDVNCAGRRGKVAILNEIVGLLEDVITHGNGKTNNIPVLSTNEPETLTASTEPEPEPEMSKVRPNGEVIRLASDGKDYGANLINRQK